MTIIKHLSHQLKHTFIVATLMLSASPAFADLKSFLTLSSDYIWRGLSMTNAAPSVQGGMVFRNYPGLSFGLYFSNESLVTGSTKTDSAGTPGYFVMPQVYHLLKLDNLQIYSSVNYYTFTPGAAHANSIEYLVLTTWQGFKFCVNYMPSFFGTASSDLYSNFGYSFQIEKDFALTLSVGYSHFSDETQTVIIPSSPLGLSSYLDWKASFLHSTPEGYAVEFGITDANLKSIDANGNKTDVRNTMKSFVALHGKF